MPAINGYIVRLTGEPELRHTSTGKPVCTFNVANEKGYGDNKRTDFITCVAWGKTAEMCSVHIHKGMAIAIEGDWDSRSYTDKNGRKVNTWQYTVTNVIFLPRNKDNNVIQNTQNADNVVGYEPDLNVQYGDFATIDDDGTSDLPF